MPTRPRRRTTHLATTFAMPAVLALVAGPALAQFDHSVYGVLDFSYGRFEPSGQLPEHRFNSNSMTASFIGVQGSWLHDSGWTLGLTLEAFIRFQELRLGRRDNDPILSRNAFASLMHRDWGQVRIGRLQTLLFNTATRFNAFGNSVAFSPPIRHVFAAGDVLGVQGDFYWNSAIAYSTPKFEDGGPLEGISATVMHSRGERNVPERHWSGTLVAARGIWAASVTAQRVRRDDFVAGPTDEDAVQVGASWNPGWAQLFAQHTEIRDVGLDVRSRTTSVGASVPVGRSTVALQIAVGQARGTAIVRKQTTTSLAYLHAWDSVTDLYVVGMDDRVEGQTRGASGAVGVRWKF